MSVFLRSQGDGMALRTYPGITWNNCKELSYLKNLTAKHSPCTDHSKTANFEPRFLTANHKYPPVTFFVASENP